MKLSHCAIAAALALAFSAGSAVADEQMSITKNISEPIVMSDAELDQVVGAGIETFMIVTINRSNAYTNSGGNAKSVTSKAQGQGNSWGAGGAWANIASNPSP